MIGIVVGDCLDALPAIPAGTVDAIVTDPPYDLTSGKRGGSGAASLNVNSPAGRARIGTGFMGKAWDGTGVAFDPATWAECLRVLKPGGHLLAFGGTRTSHRLVCAIEDAGFEIRDGLCWLYGSGFPKSLNVSKAIDKAAGAERAVVGRASESTRVASSWQQDDGPPHGYNGNPEGVRLLTAPATPEAERWEGWGTALKPAHEPIALARKPLIGTVAANVLAHDTGALNVDACRVGTTTETHASKSRAERTGFIKGFVEGTETVRHDHGRWPANVLLDPEAAALLDEQTGKLHSQDPATRNSSSPRSGLIGFADSGLNYADSGGASRFFYCAKASSKERNAGLGEKNTHPTVKPIALMRWLVRLVTPPGGIVLDPFAGSGTTGIACVLEGLNFIGVEREADYAEIARARIAEVVA